MEKTLKLLLCASIIFNFQLSPTLAQNKDTQKVVVVDDEACGCELYFIDGIQTV